MDLDYKEDSGFGLIRNKSIMNILSNINDEHVREQYLNSLRNENKDKFKEFMEIYKLFEEAKE